MLKYLFFLSTVAILPLCARGAGGGPTEQHAKAEGMQTPWFTGPLLCPSSHTVTKGHMNIEPYFYGIKNYGLYDHNWHPRSASHIDIFNPLVFIQAGISKKMGGKVLVQGFYTKNGDEHAWRFGDLPVGFDYQILMDAPGKSHPAIKFSFYEILPTGKYQKLNPHKKGTDASGSGSFISVPGIVFGRLFHFSGIHFLATRLAFSYAIPAPVHVKGLNTYGGTTHTRGKVHPGNLFTGTLGLEYSLTQNWVLACDVQTTYRNKTRFSGHTGGAPVSPPSGSQWSVAPAIEYNWNANWGVIGGVWWDVAGRNTPQFVSGVIAINYSK